MEAKTSDVLVLGGGVIGLACARALLRAGRGVTVVDQGAVGGATSHGNCGTITPSHAPPLAMPGMLGKALKMMLRKDAPFWVQPRCDPELALWLLRFSRRCNWQQFRQVTQVKAALLRRSRELLAEVIASERIDCGFEQRGTLSVFREQRELDASGWLFDSLREVGMEVEVLDGNACRAREPVLNDAIVGGLFNAQDAHLRPERYAAGLARVVREAGGEIVEHAPAGGFRVEGGRIASVTAGELEYHPREVVLALGPWTPRVARELGLRIPVQPGKGYSITFERPPQAPATPLVLKERSVCVTAWDDGLRLGSTMEFSGYDTSLNRTRLDALTRAVPEYLREPITTRRIEEWYGWRPMTYDDLPIIGRAGPANLVLATGHGMLGVTLSAVTGELVAHVIAGAKATPELAACAPARFARRAA